ncbi:MAG: hypothetical protein GC184_09380 [Rhizobiales bacterium]|nr:hypothetical protein [Hyphomicrobiales bacterium]
MSARFEITADVADLTQGDQPVSDSTVMGLFTKLFEGLALSQAPDAKVRPLSINCDFVNQADGDVALSGSAVVTRATRSVMFMSAEIKTGERFIATATAVYKTLPKA